MTLFLCEREAIPWIILGEENLFTWAAAGGWRVKLFRGTKQDENMPAQFNLWRIILQHDSMSDNISQLVFC